MSEEPDSSTASATDAYSTVVRLKGSVAEFTSNLRLHASAASRQVQLSGETQLSAATEKVARILQQVPSVSLLDPTSSGADAATVEHLTEQLAVARRANDLLDAEAIKARLLEAELHEVQGAAQRQQRHADAAIAQLGRQLADGESRVEALLAEQTRLKRVAQTNQHEALAAELADIRKRLRSGSAHGANVELQKYHQTFVNKCEQVKELTGRLGDAEKKLADATLRSLHLEKVLKEQVEPLAARLAGGAAAADDGRPSASSSPRAAAGEQQVQSDEVTTSNRAYLALQWRYASLVNDHKELQHRYAIESEAYRKKITQFQSAQR